MRRCVCLLLILVLPGIVSADEAPDGFAPLFNGRNLDNWVLTNTPAETWTVKDNMLICSGKPYGEIRTRDMYQNFIFEVEWRHLVPRGNAGIFLWADDIPARGVPFHRGIEVQVLEHAYGNTRSHTTHGDIFPIHGARMTPDNGRGGSRAFPTEMRGRPAPEWNHYRITCNDGSVTLEVNGAKVTSGRNCSPRKGYLCLESEGGIVHFRNMWIKKLPDTPLEDRHIAISNRRYQSLYTGLNLSGWRSGNEDLSDSTEADGWTVSDWKLRHRGDTSQLTSIPLSKRSGILLDVRRVNQDAAVKIVLSSQNSTIDLVRLAGEDSTQNVNEKAGQWNRIECDWTEGRLKITINGKAIDAREVPGDALTSPRLVLHGTGSLELANLFAR